MKVKLIGSKTEQDYREQLIRGYNSLFHNENNKRLLSVLKEFFPVMKSAYFLECIPEQGEDIYTILINTDIIASVELDR